MVYSHYSLNKYPSLDPHAPQSYGEVFTGYSINTGRIGAVTSTQTAMQVAEVEARLREGLSVVETSIINPQIFDYIPEEHFKEIKRLAKLAGAEITMHAPLIDTSGFVQGRWGGEEARQNAERHYNSIIERTKLIVEGENRNIPVVIHPADVNVIAREWEQKEGKKGPQIASITAVNVETGQLTPIQREIEYSPTKKEKIETDPYTRLQEQNQTYWDERLREAHTIRKEIDEFSEKAGRAIERLKEIDKKIKAEKRDAPTEQEKIEATYLQSNISQNQRAAEHYNQMFGSRVKHMYEQVMKYGSDNIKKQLSKIPSAFESDLQSLNKVKDERERNEIEHDLRIQTYHKTLSKLGEINQKDIPKIFQPVEEFAREHASKTVGNVAFNAAWDKKSKAFHKNAPVIVLENIFPNMAFATAKGLRELIEASRKQFVNNAMKQGVNKAEAEKAAEMRIGATWDIGNLNLYKRYGFGEEKLIEETKEIAKYVKHNHVHDNFGFESSHLAPGMGNVPIDKLFKILKDQGYKGKHILEASGYPVQFKGLSPQPYSLEALNAPIYYPAIGGPSWTQEPGYAAHFSGYGMFLPEQHFAMYGGGFSQLPVELGGRSAGRRGDRFSGTPME